MKQREPIRYSVKYGVGEPVPVLLPRWRVPGCIGTGRPANQGCTASDRAADSARLSRHRNAWFESHTSMGPSHPRESGEPVPAQNWVAEPGTRRHRFNPQGSVPHGSDVHNFQPRFVTIGGRLGPAESQPPFAGCPGPTLDGGRGGFGSGDNPPIPPRPAVRLSEVQSCVLAIAVRPKPRRVPRWPPPSQVAGG